jgi:hypothetical protein
MLTTAHGVVYLFVLIKMERFLSHTTP